jgi:hypothetical protein
MIIRIKKELIKKVLNDTGKLPGYIRNVPVRKKCKGVIN